jgi:uncharacterized protein (TIGR02391 family)
MATVPPFDDGTIEGIAKIVGDTSWGFTGAEIGRLLRVCRIEDPGEMTKWRRIAAALSNEQARVQSGSCTVAFVKAAMKPVRWSSDPVGFRQMRENLNTVLAFSGLRIGEDGQVYRREKARTHEEAAVAKRLRDEMIRRQGHAEIFKYCTNELVAEDCFGAVFEASKGLCQRVREMCGVDEDGHGLVQAAFEGPNPMIAFNSLRSDTERNEQRGLASLMKGVVSAFRNPEAHEPKRFWHVSEADALDVLSTVSLIHRRLDLAVVIHKRTG